MNNSESVGATKKVAYVLDKSGSMGSCCREAVEGTNRFLDSLREEDPHTRISITLFDTQVAVPARDLPVAEVPGLTPEAYRPGGCTALYDAVGHTILTLDESAKEDEFLLVAILTDGMENSSVRFTQGDVFRMIQERQATGRWTFVFLGADQDSWASAERLGIDRRNATNFAHSDVADSMGKLGRMSSRYLRQQAVTRSARTSSFFAGIKDMKDVDPEDESLQKSWLENTGETPDPPTA